MKNILYLILIGFLFSSNNLSQNGENWKSWEFTRKVGYVDGFLDGFKGFIWHFMQGWWYRMLVDVKCYEFKRKKKKYSDIKELIEIEYGYKL